MGAARKLFVADLFCGAGGTSTGMAQACRDLDLAVELLAINHWETAIATHTKNHPWARHLCANLDTIDPRKVVPGGHLDLLVASPECTHHSVARGGKPINDQSRASAWRVLEWCEKLDVSNVLVENVPEFQNWGPISWNTKRPVKAKVGEIFRQWVATLRAMNYRVEWKVLNAADFGGATTRKRLFVIAKKGNAKIRFPEQTHAKDADKTGDIFKKLKPWRAAREIIDWTLPGESIFTRKRPLARTTLERIAAGLRKFCGAAAEPFLVILRRHMDGKSIEEPVPCLTASGQHVGLCVPKPFVTVLNANNVAKSPDQPLPTVTGGNRFFLTEFVFQQQSGGAPRSVSEPLPTIAGKGAQFFIVPFYGEREGQKPRTHDVSEPLPAPTSHGAGALVEPFVVTPGGTDLPGGRAVFDPLPTVMGRARFAVVEPHLVKFYRDPKSQNQSLKEPLHTVTTKDRHGLVEPMIGTVGIDIRFRMLRPHELAAAMGFEHYIFTGTREQQVKQIGNAVSVEMARALVKAILA